MNKDQKLNFLISELKAKIGEADTSIKYSYRPEAYKHCSNNNLIMHIQVIKEDQKQMLEALLKAVEELKEEKTND